MTEQNGTWRNPDAPRRMGLGVLKAVLSLALVGILLWKIPVSDALAGLASLSPTAVVVILVLTFLFPAVAALRWQRALARLGAPQSWWALMRDTLVSSTYNMLLPTNIGGDVVRAVRCAKRLRKAHHSWSSALFERLVGLVALALLAVPGLAMAPFGSSQLSLLVAGVLIASVGVLVVAPSPMRAASRALTKRAPVVAGVGEGIAADLSGPLGALSARLEMFAWSAVYQAVGLGTLVVVVFDWGQPTHTWAILGAVPLALILTLLPVSIAGLGVRESLFVVLLGQYGIPATQALSLALVWLACALVLALAGAVVLIAEAAKGVKNE